MLKIAHITWEFPSLTETFIANEVEALTRLGCEVKVVPLGRARASPASTARRSWGLARSAITRPVTAAVLLARCVRFGVRVTMLEALLRLQRQLESESFDLVHAQFGYVGRLCMPVLAGFKSLPLVVSFRGQDASALPLKDPGMYAALFRRGRLFLARSEAMRRDLIALGCFAEKVRVHHSGIDLSRFPFRVPLVASNQCHAPGPLRILLVGRLIEKKGCLDAVVAFAEARSRHPNLQLRIIGEGPLRDRIAQEIAARGLSDSALLLGPRAHEEVAAEMAAAHLFILPSRTAPDGDKEGIPNALMEAMASGLPVLSTRHAGIPECVEDGVSGLLVPEGNPAALAEGLCRLIETPASWPALARAGRARIETEFNRETQARRLVSLYEEVLHHREA